MKRVRLERDQLWGGQFYLKGDRLIPDDLAIALGLMPQAIAPEEPSEGAIALSLINQAMHPSELEPLPSIGKATARILIERRPDGGYASLEDAAKINSDKSHIDWDAIALWEDEDALLKSG